MAANDWTVAHVAAQHSTGLLQTGCYHQCSHISYALTPLQPRSSSRQTATRNHMLQSGTTTTTLMYRYTIRLLPEIDKSSPFLHGHQPDADEAYSPHLTGHLARQPTCPSTVPQQGREVTRQHNHPWCPATEWTEVNTARATEGFRHQIHTPSSMAELNKNGGP